jgi:ribosomal-protein-alanine N-acetyltransferase
MVVPRCTIPQAAQRETFARSVPADSCVAPNVATTAPVESLQQNVGPCPTYGTCQDAAPEAADLANIADLDALLDLERRCQDLRPGLSRRSLRHLLLSPNAKTFVIRKDGKVLADALVTKRKTRVGTMARLHNVTVDSSRRGMGYGQMLLASCIEVLRKEGVVSMFLEADVKNAAAIGLYDSMGFAKVRLLADHYAPGQDAWKMRLDFVRHSTKQAGNVVESMPLFEMAK